MTRAILGAIPDGILADGCVDAANLAECEISQTLNNQQLSGLESLLEQDRKDKL